MSDAEMKGWRPMGALFMGRKAFGRMLALQVMSMDGASWTAAAVETSDTAVGAGMAAVFKDHAHKALGDFPDLRAAMDACEVYGASWAAARAGEEACACGEIAPVGELAP